MRIKNPGTRIHRRKPRLIKPILREIMLDLCPKYQLKQNHKGKDT